MMKGRFSERDCGLGNNQEEGCFQEHKLFFKSLLGLDFLIAGGVDHSVGAIPHVFVCRWKTSSPKALLS